MAAIGATRSIHYARIVWLASPPLKRWTEGQTREGLSEKMQL